MVYLFLLCSYCSFSDWPSVDSIPGRPHWEQMSKGLRKNAATLEETDEDRAPGVGGEHGSEMLTMFKMMMEEQRRNEIAREEARRAEEERKEETSLARDEVRRQEDEKKEEVRREREAEYARRQLEQQTALEARQYEQQVALMKIQAEIGERASKAHREGQSADRKRDRALYSIPSWKEGEDLEEFLLTAERRLRAAEISEKEWIVILDAKLSGKMASAWQDISVTVEDYQEAKDRLLKVCGYTPRLAADGFYGFRAEQSKGMTADQLFHRGLQLLRRMVSPHKMSEGVEFALLRGWVSFVISKKARAALDARVIKDSSELINALQDFLVLEGDRTEGQAAIFGRGSDSNEKGSDGNWKGSESNWKGSETHKEARGPLPALNVGRWGTRLLIAGQEREGLVCPKLLQHLGEWLTK